MLITQGLESLSWRLWVNTLVMFEVFYLLNSRFLIEPAWHPRVLIGNPYVPPAIVLVIGFQLLYTYAPFMQVAFHSAALDAAAWLRILLIASTVFVVVEIEKGLARRLNRGHLS
ncbi:cation transporting ATPase C-terminal domain-containing protein [Lamprocystis purpurea]|uniref:cation transporting ATPase C-terminal domain-containing protein n=1 Tax=Lamprocystis purpurea TaxID=61598 RepID=UPI00146A7952|nr:cation transporting ATPase C-terminal domain-containing protein [Lamprocystis purpurea]